MISQGIVQKSQGKDGSMGDAGRSWPEEAKLYAF